jgi:hypothetical protein
LGRRQVPRDRSGLNGTREISKIGTFVRNRTQVKNISLDAVLFGLLVPDRCRPTRPRSTLSTKKMQVIRRRSCRE